MFLVREIQKKWIRDAFKKEQTKYDKSISEASKSQNTVFTMLFHFDTDI